MTKRITTYIATCLCCLGCMLPANAQLSREYTADRPLTIVSDWEFPPYEFRNDRGEPDGYNVEVLDLILKRLEIPHKFVMQEWYLCTRTFENREADLIHALSYMYKKRPYVMTQNMITYYPLRSVRRKSQEPLTRISQLSPGDTLMLKNNDYAALRIKQERDSSFKVEYRSPKEALTAIRNGRNSHYIWGEIPLKMKIKEYALDSLVLDEIDIPAGELRIIGYDKEIIEAIDDTYARLEQSGELQAIYDKWFYPERIHNDSSPIAVLILVGAIIAIIIIFLLSRLIRNRVRAAINRTTDVNNMMSQALKMGNLYVMEYDVATDSYRNIYGNILPEGGLTHNEFMNRLPAEDHNDFLRHNTALILGETNLWSFTRRFNLGSEIEPDWHYLQGDAIVEKEDGKTRYVIYSMKDITQEVNEERINSETGNKYMKVFESNLIAMSFYGRDGKLIDLNEQMRKLCQFDEEGEAYFRSVCLYDVPMVKGIISPTQADYVHMCQHMYYPEIGIDKHIEIRLLPILDESGELRFFVVTARDVTAEREMYLELRKHEAEIHSTNEEISRYESQLNYLLENSQMFIWSYSPENDMITISRSAHKNEYQVTPEQFFEGIDGDPQEKRNDIKKHMQEGKTYNAILHFNHTHLEKHPVWYSISGVPTFDNEGHLTSYFGFSRNITKLMDIQQQLKEETARAEDSGKMKSAFLANMTHEIRTPLNAIVGFSDLLPVVETAEERMEFIRIIRNNCDMLMRLINDILEASNIGQALAIQPVECDMSKVFDDICQSLAQRVQEPGVSFVKDNPYATCITTLDKGRIQQVLTNFVTNAVKYTHEGYIKVGYHWDRRIPKDGTESCDGLVFYCLDTGAGIPKEKQASVFERFVKLNDFVQGTGLGLSICQAIADRCNGFIGVTSEGEGHGSSFWLWIPCERK